MEPDLIRAAANGALPLPRWVSDWNTRKVVLNGLGSATFLFDSQPGCSTKEVCASRNPSLLEHSPGLRLRLRRLLRSALWT